MVKSYPIHPSGFVFCLYLGNCKLITLTFLVMPVREPNSTNPVDPIHSLYQVLLPAQLLPLDEALVNRGYIRQSLSLGRGLLLFQSHSKQNISFHPHKKTMRVSRFHIFSILFIDLCYSAEVRQNLKVALICICLLCRDYKNLWRYSLAIFIYFRTLFTSEAQF